MQHSNGVLLTLSNIGCAQFAQKKGWTPLRWTWSHEPGRYHGPHGGGMEQGAGAHWIATYHRQQIFVSKWVWGSRFGANFGVHHQSCWAISSPLNILFFDG
jgi:hypothetical protein